MADKLRPLLAVVAVLMVSGTAVADEEACAELRETQAAMFAHRDSGELFSDEHHRAMEAHFNADRKVRYLSEQYGYGARTTVELVEHLQDTADVARWAVFRWLSDSRLSISRDMMSLAEQISENAGRLESKLADLLCQMHEAGVETVQD